jgi:hypothetical protein
MATANVREWLVQFLIAISRGVVEQLAQGSDAVLSPA